MRTHVTVLGALHLLCGLVLLAWAAAILFGFSLLGAFVAAQDSPDAGLGGAILHLIGTFGSGFFAAIGLALVASGGGLLAHKSWARILAIILCGLGLASVPLGTLIGIYGLWTLFHRDTEALFRPAVRD